MASGFAFSVPGGLNRDFYLRFREMRKKFNLNDREMIEVLIKFALRGNNLNTLENIVSAYVETPPSEAEPLPKVS